MLTKNKKNSFKTQAALMTLGTLAPVAPTLMTNVGNVVAHADTFTFKDGTTVSGGQEGVPVPQRLTTPSDEATQVKITPFTWTIRVVNQQTGQQLKSDDITFTPKSDTVTVNQKTGANEVHYTVTDTAGIFKSNDYSVPDGDINFNDIISGAQQGTNGNTNRGGAKSLTQNSNALSDWVFGAKDADGLTPYILPQLNDPNVKQAKQAAQVSGDANHKVLTFNVIPNTAQTKNKNSTNNSGSYVVPATGQDTGSNKATTNNGGSSTGSTSNGSNTNHGSNTTNTNASANKANNVSGQQSSQQDADTQQIINYINQHAEQKVNISSNAKLLTSFPVGENDAISWADDKGFDQYTVWTNNKEHFVQIYYNPQTKQFFATEDGNEHTLLTKAQLLQLFGLHSKNSTNGNTKGTNGVLGSGSLGGTTGGSTAGGLAQTNTQTKQNASILLSAIAGTALLGFGLTKDGKLKL